MNSRPLLDYLAYPEHLAEETSIERATVERPEAVAVPPADALHARLKDLAARLRENMPPASTPAPKQDLTLSAQIEAILKRKMPQAADARPLVHSRHDAPDPAARRARLVIDPPPSAPAIDSSLSVEPDFAKFSEAVYLIGQAARRFVDQPHPVAAPARQAAPIAPSSAEIDTLAAVLRETVSAFRSVADDLAVSAGEIRNIATRSERVSQAPPLSARKDRDDISELQETVAAFRSVARELAASAGEIRAAARNDDRPPSGRRSRHDRYREDEEIHELRETVTDLQDRLDTLLHARRRTRY